MTLRANYMRGNSKKIHEESPTYIRQGTLCSMSTTNIGKHESRTGKQVILKLPQILMACNDRIEIDVQRCVS
jgi:hypothetical protein